MSRSTPWRKLHFLPIVLAACVSPPDAQSIPAPPIVVEPKPVETPKPAAEAPTWRVHKCQRLVRWPHYAGPDTDKPPTREESWEEGSRSPNEDAANPTGVGGNYTLDEKRDALNKRRKTDGVCDTRHRDTLAAAILKRPTPAPASSSRASATAFDHAALVRSALALTPDEERKLATDGVVVPDRLAYDSYTTAYYDVHRAQLPVYVSVDSIMHAVFASHDQFLAAIEMESMAGRLDTLLGAMHCGLAGAAKKYPAQIANDVDLYLTVARSLLAGQPVLSELGKVDAQAAELVEMVTTPTAMETVELFGRHRALDTTAFTPRGHYDSPELAAYFRSAMWLSRIDLNLASRDTRASTPGYLPDPSETPREAVVALALADLAERTRSLDDIAVLDRAWRILAGAREDVSFADLVKLRAKAKIGKLSLEAAPALRAAIGGGFVRTVNTGPTPNVARLPVISTLLGARITPDTVAIGGLIAERGPAASAAELGYMLGVDRARAYVSNEAGIDKVLAKARTDLAAAKPGDDLYSAWLGAIRALAILPAGAKPSFMDTAVFQDLRLNTVLAAFGQLRHNHILLVAQAYDQGGCEIPDGYVEPAPAAYAALADYARRGAKAFRTLDPKDRTHGVAYFARLEKLMRVLVSISNEELANKPLSADTKRFLSMIVEQRIATAQGYGGPYPVATFDGWYLDLFPNTDTALEDPSFIADWATYDRDGRQGVHYVGAKQPRLGVFAVDTGGTPRLMVGPVATAFQHTGDLVSRLTDSDVPTLTGDTPWAKGYTVSAVAMPALEIGFSRGDAVVDRLMKQRADAPPPNVVRIDAKVALGAATIELLDHHFEVMAELPITLARGRTDTAVRATPRPIEALRVRIGKAAQRFDLPLAGDGHWATTP